MRDRGRLRVLVTADTVGGVFTYAVDLARALGRRGARVVLATMGGPMSDAQRAITRRVEGLEVVESVYRLEWMSEPWDDVTHAGRWLLGLAGRARADVVHVNGYAHAALPFGVPVVAVAHSCVLSWWRAVHGEEAPASWDRYRAEVTRGLAQASAVVAPSRAMLDAIAAHYGAPRCARVIPNGRDAQGLGPAAKEPIVLAAGRVWDRAKDLAALGRVAPRLRAPVYVAGDERDPFGVKRSVEGVVALGALAPAELAGWMARAAIFAAPARYEPFGLSALEAGLSGCALVLGDLPSQREIWGDAATYARPGDDEALARALARLVESPALCASMGARARARALRFTPDAMAAAYLDLYASLGVAAAARLSPPEEPPCA